ncbi:MAG TPA: glycine cleavage T C-terminal barrel domain-containing protein [Rhizomicrobium sp.]|nr:glycine cleavage T C-terminal barrel domain-containing protein [Rhizomicrobium sp.]
MTMLVRATPFHSRVAAANRLNAWVNRNDHTLAAHYGDVNAEAIAPHATAAMADISWRWRVTIEGAGSEEFLTRLLTRNPAKLSPGQAFKALWLSDRGAVRGAGAIARFGRESFQIVATQSDFDWIARGAALFDVRVREIEEGGLAIVGPYAAKIFEAAGFGDPLEALKFRKLFWRGLDITLSRFGEHAGFEVWCKPDDALILWGRLLKAGEPFAMKLAGLHAMDLLDLVAGVPRPERDYEAARDGFATAPTPFELKLESLIDDDHLLFNGRAASLSAPRTRTRVGIELDGDKPAPHAPLLHNGQRAGRTMGSLYSPALQRAIALATVDLSSAKPGTRLTLPDGTAAKVVDLPFLPVPDPIAE